MTTLRLPNKLELAHLPTPLVHYDALDALVGTEVWVKRDDASAGPEAGNKIRKLEFLLADALRCGAQVVITCGGVQSNHARATAICARRLGLSPLLLLRTPDGRAPAKPWSGNLLLDAIVGAELRFITPEQYGERDVSMQRTAAELGARGVTAYVIPEGGSNGLGSLGYVTAMAETKRQLEAGAAGSVRRFDAVVHACGSGGTAAGVAIGAALYDLADEVLVMAVCDDSAYFERVIERIQAEADAAVSCTLPRAKLRVIDRHKGPAYAVPSDEQMRFIVEVARCTGLVLDPVYTGKALFGLAHMESKPARALFLHTGGLPGFLAETERFAPIL